MEISLKTNSIEFKKKFAVIIGLHYGDEGKGKIVDALAPNFDYVCRFQGGPNAGHTLVVNDKKFVLNQIPSGISREKCVCVIARGVVLDLFRLMEELFLVEDLGFLHDKKRLRIGDDVPLILPFHIQLDQYSENSLGQNKIGTTGSGIAPAYEDVAGRRAVLVRDLFDEEILRTKIAVLTERFKRLTDCRDADKVSMINLSAKKLIDQLLLFGQKIKPFVQIDVPGMLNAEMAKGKTVLCEGAQGTYLDVWQGSLPFTTSSSTLAANASISLGIAPNKIDAVVGVIKAYGTRVGEGPMATEDKSRIGDKLRELGNEFGSKTGRPRRCGWMDLPAIKRAVMLNGVTHLVITKLDILSQFKEFKVCISYLCDGDEVRDYKPHLADQLKPLYKSFPCLGEFSADTSVVNMNTETKQFLRFIEEYLQIPVFLIGTGPGREQICRVG